MYLLDTDTLSEIKKIKAGKADAQVTAWASRTSPLLCWLSTITILETTRGILRLERRDPKQAANLRAWLDEQVLVAFADRVLPFGLREAQACAALHIPDPRPERDAMIAATALVHGLTVVTRNVKDFAPIKVQVFNPWAVHAG